LVPCLAELERYYAFANRRWWGNALPRHVIINLAARGPRQTPGWFGPFRWELRGRAGSRLHELVLAAESAGADVLAVLATLHTAMVHLGCEGTTQAVHPRSGYHGRRFRDEAQRRGLSAEKQGWRGWCQTRFPAATRRVIRKDFRPDRAKFAAFRLEAEGPGDPTRYRLWMCRPCRVRARVASDDFRATCDRCGRKFARVKKPRRTRSATRTSLRTRA